MTDALPDSFAVIAEVIGNDAASSLVREFPRRNVKSTSKGRVIFYVPSSMPEDHAIARIIGHDNALKLARRFGGEILFLANCDAMRSNDLKRAVAAAIEAGASGAMAARVFGVSRQYANRVGRKQSAMGASVN